MKSVFLIFFFLFQNTLVPQSFEFIRSIGSFQNASSFSISPLGFIFISDVSSNSVYKYDTLGTKLKEIGGYGWDANQFDMPVHISATIMNVYVTDRNNNRIQIFDKNLNLVSILSSKNIGYNEPPFSFPIASGISRQGDVFILDSDNKVVLKYDLLGNYNSSFGGIDAGTNSLVNPIILFVSFNNEVFIIDDNKFLKAFDTFGSFMLSKTFSERIESINGVYEKVLITLKNKVLIQNKTNTGYVFSEISLTDFEQHEDFVSAVLFNNSLFILTKSNILVFRQTGE